MNTHSDFEDLLRSFAGHKARYLIVGGYAVAYYGHPRYTKYLDLFYDDAPENIDRIRAALIDFGFPEASVPISLFTEAGTIIRFGVPPVCIDLLNRIDGVSFNDAYAHKVDAHYGEAPVHFIARTDLLLNKRASARPQDLIDAHMLDEHAP